MSRANKTGGGPGTNQYKIRGQSKRRVRKVSGFPADQVIKRGQCVWLRTGFDDVWCLKHRQLDPELRELARVVPCIITLSPTLPERLAALLPPSACGPWAGRVSVHGDCVWPQSGPDGPWCLTHRQLAPELRELVGLPACVTRLGDLARLAQVLHLPAEQLGWATRDPEWYIRKMAAYRMPVDQLAWAAQDPEADVRQVAALRMPEDQLQWATQDPNEDVREIAAERMPVEQIEWALRDPDERVHKAAAKRTRARSAT